MNEVMDEIEKAKVIRNVGEAHPNGKWVWTEYKPGKFDWRGIKSKAGTTARKTAKTTAAVGTGAKADTKQPVAKTDDKVLSKKISELTPKEVLSFAKEATTAQLSAAVNDKKNDKQLRQLIFNELRKRGDYVPTEVDSSDLPNGYVKKPDSKVDYKAKPKLDLVVPESIILKINGKPVKVSTSSERKKVAALSDKDLIKKIGNPKGTHIIRQIAVEEAAARGIKESELDFSGTLKKFWNREQSKHDLAEQMKGNENEDEAEEYNIDLKGFDMEEFMDKFPGGDIGWMNKKNNIVQKSFDFNTLVGRQRYDAVLDYQQRLLPSYLSPSNKLGALNQEYHNFVAKDTTPFFVSAGGAGAGKSFGLWAILDYNNVPELPVGSDPSASSDWGWVNASNPQDHKDFEAMLGRYNGTYTGDDGEEHGHILVFDDADKILTSKQTQMDALMKKILDNNPDARVFNNPETGENEIWKGRIIVLTNKDVSSISEKSEDKKAMLSRGKTNNLVFTRNEVIEIVQSRYKSMGLGSYQKAFEKDFPDPDKQAEVRQTAFDFLKDNVNNSDPGKFTPRMFIDVISHIGPKIADGSTSKMVGTVQLGTNIPWQISALDIIKGDENEFNEEAMMDRKTELLSSKKTMKTENPELYNLLYGEKAVSDFLTGCFSTSNSQTVEKGGLVNEREQEVKKAFENSFGGMSVEDAEDIILN